MRLVRVVGAGWLVACASGALVAAACVAERTPVLARGAPPPARTIPESAPPASAEAEVDAAPSAPESERDRELRFAKGKRDQCLRLGTAIEVVLPDEAAMLVEGNSPELARMAREMERAASEIDQVPLETVGLVALRGELTTNWRSMAEFLTEAAAAEDAQKGKRALERFRDRESRVPAIYGKLSELCNARGRS